MRPIVSSDWLAAHLDDPGFRIVDVRWYLDPRRKGREAYDAGHIPGAVFLDVEGDLAAPGGRPGGRLGRHPWPPPDQVARVLGKAGIDAGIQVVAYDDQAGAVAARLWFLLKAYGHDGAAVLDGGYDVWLSEGRPTETAAPVPAPLVFEPRPVQGLVLSKEDLLAPEAGRVLLDARVPERYRGEVEPIDPRAGHIPGARNAPFTANLTTGPLPRFRPPEDLRERFRALGVEGGSPVVYCGSGVTACHDLLALELAGVRGRLYAGSWSEWCADPALPVEP